MRKEVRITSEELLNRKIWQFEKGNEKISVDYDLVKTNNSSKYIATRI